MKFGLNMPAHIDSWKDMMVAEELGFASAWFYDSQMLYSDIYATMTLVAEHTKRIKIGTGIVVPSNRIAPVTAHSIATINQLAPGRVMLGIGTGFTGRNMMGLPPVKLDDLREHVRICLGLLRGDEVLFREGKRERWIRFMHPALGYINIEKNIPIIIAAQGPKALAVAGAIGDGWMVPVSGVEEFKQNFDVVKSAAKRAGRAVQNFSATMFAAACVLKPGESFGSARVMSQMGPMAAVALHALWESSAVAGQLPSSLRSIYEKYRDEYVNKLDVPADRRYLKVHEGHTIYVKPGEERYLTPEVIAAFSMTAPRESLIERIRELEAAGMDKIAFSVPNEGARERIEELGREIVSHY